ncbi:MAG: aminopeptidase [Anaeroplasmataceae bacterium]|nr:aminopeptidase [Anaeroplasmataceae bacterium]MDE6241120.1 aminopeptidase [Anaeroplasmataceae bacterium]
MKEEILKNYAKLIVKTGVNVQKDQDVVISASVEDAYFVKYVVEEAYKAGARTVVVDWNYQPLSKLSYEYESVETLKELPEWYLKKQEYRVEKLPAMIHIISEDPDGLSGIDQAKLLEVQMAIGPVLMKYREQKDNKFQWTIVGIPGEKWAKKVFPKLSTEKAMEALWDAILKVTRVYGDPIENWNKHNTNLAEKTSKLNALGIKTLTYKSKNGTDFTIDIHPELNFLAGGETTLSGVFYNPNMPTEECFTSPVKTSCNGVVMATKPLSVRGVLVSDFGFRFENGKAVEVICKNSEYKDVLEKLISTDEGAAMLGEVALVPYDSPINQTNLLFYNTLYDENACCHLALGRAFTECIKNYQTKSEEEIKKVDLNTSMIHVDFMIGSKDLNITAETYDGKTIEIFKNGTWAI